MKRKIKGNKFILLSLCIIILATFGCGQKKFASNNLGSPSPSQIAYGSTSQVQSSFEKQIFAFREFLLTLQPEKLQKPAYTYSVQNLKDIHNNLAMLIPLIPDSSVAVREELKNIDDKLQKVVETDPPRKQNVQDIQTILGLQNDPEFGYFASKSTKKLYYLLRNKTSFLSIKNNQFQSILYALSPKANHSFTKSELEQISSSLKSLVEALAQSTANEELSQEKSSLSIINILLLPLGIKDKVKNLNNEEFKKLDKELDYLIHSSDKSKENSTNQLENLQKNLTGMRDKDNKRNDYIKMLQDFLFDKQPDGYGIFGTETTQAIYIYLTSSSNRIENILKNLEQQLPNPQQTGDFLTGARKTEVFPFWTIIVPVLLGIGGLFAALNFYPVLSGKRRRVYPRNHIPTGIRGKDKNLPRVMISDANPNSSGSSAQGKQGTDFSPQVSTNSRQIDNNLNATINDLTNQVANLNQEVKELREIVQSSSNYPYSSQTISLSASSHQQSEISLD